jgi:uncharacterized protein (TIGR02647 family)
MDNHGQRRLTAYTLKSDTKQPAFTQTKLGTYMTFTPEMITELDLLLKFPMKSLRQGLKIHQDAEPEVIKAAKRLFDKGIVTQADGGYLTDLGHDLAEHVQIMQSTLAHPTK